MAETTTTTETVGAPQGTVDQKAAPATPPVTPGATPDADKAKADATAKANRKAELEERAGFAKLKRERKAFEAAQAKAQQEREADQKFQKENPFEWLTKRGFDLSKIAEAEVSKKTKTPGEAELDELKATVKQLLSDREPEKTERQKALEQHQKAQETQAVTARKAQVAKAHQALDKAKFPFLASVSSEEAADAAYAFAEQRFEEEGADTSAEEAFTALEKDLRSKLEHLIQAAPDELLTELGLTRSKTNGKSTKKELTNREATARDATETGNFYDRDAMRRVLEEAQNRRA